MQEFFITRAPMPGWVTDAPQWRRGRVGRMLEDQVEWHFATPWLYRALASPWTGEPVLAAPPAPEAETHRCAYWASALSLLTYRLGWPYPERGLLRWIEQGRPPDPTLALVHQVLRTDRTLPLLMDWLAEKPEILVPQFVNVGYRPPTSEERPRRHKYDGYGPWQGPWQLHLEDRTRGHLAGPLRLNTTGRVELATSVDDDRRATVTSETMAGWYVNLCKVTGAELPQRGTDWEVDVWVRSVGHLGKFRRSAATGLWSAAREEVHLWGAQP